MIELRNDGAGFVYLFVCLSIFLNQVIELRNDGAGFGFGISGSRNRLHGKEGKEGMCNLKGEMEVT